MPSKKNKTILIKLNDIGDITDQISRENGKIQLIHFPDSFIEKCFLKILAKSISYKYISSSEVDSEWLVNEFLNPSLFSMGERDFYYLGRAEVLKKDSIDLMISESFKNLEHELLISFTGKDKNLAAIIKSENEMIPYKVDLPKFWDCDQLISFFAKSLELNISKEAIIFLSQILEYKSDLYYHAIEKLKLYQGQSLDQVGVKECKELITFNKIDQFELADLFSNKQFKQFYKKLVKDQLDLDWFRFFSNFMQGHLFKMLDVSYTQKKAKLSKYDQKIINCSRNWEKEDLLKEMKFFGEIEIMAKRKDPFLLHRLRRLSF